MNNAYIFIHWYQKVITAFLFLLTELILPNNSDDLLYSEMSPNTSYVLYVLYELFSLTKAHNMLSALFGIVMLFHMLVYMSAELLTVLITLHKEDTAVLLVVNELLGFHMWKLSLIENDLTVLYSESALLMRATSMMPKCENVKKTTTNN